MYSELCGHFCFSLKEHYDGLSSNRWCGLPEASRLPAPPPLLASQPPSINKICDVAGILIFDYLKTRRIISTTINLLPLNS